MPKRGTKELFKRDVQIMKRSLLRTFFVSAGILIALIGLSVSSQLVFVKMVDWMTVYYWTIIISPIALLGYFMFDVMVTRGYKLGQANPYYPSKTNIFKIRGVLAIIVLLWILIYWVYQWVK